MKFRLICSIAILLILLVVVGCSGNKQEANNTENDEKKENISQILTPPKLVISVGQDTIKPILGTYNWSVMNVDGTGKSVQADSGAPPSLVGNQEPSIITSSTVIILGFEIPPIKYEIRTWDADNNITGTYKELVLSNHKGKNVFEVLAYWDQGTASYAFLLDIE